MADEGGKSGDAGAGDATAGGGAAPGAQSGHTGPAVNVLGQYIKDLSFENPKAPDSFLGQKDKTPPLNVTVNVSARQVGENNVEVELKLDARAGSDDEVLFNIELLYAGVFQIRNVPQEQLHPFILIECPRLLFPFARQIVADTVSSGGFPPLLLDPIDFASLYRQRMQQQAPQAPAGQPQQPPPQPS